uniref:Uncharacterized protein n=1 Tax=Leishmania guyanensis TaxID=5670 RepID=A0A1E1IR29_LEIGU|nr:Hypothetical protein BN36_1112070 [Leishmania guyanensis]
MRLMYPSMSPYFFFACDCAEAAVSPAPAHRDVADHRLTDRAGDTSRVTSSIMRFCSPLFFSLTLMSDSFAPPFRVAFRFFARMCLPSAVLAALSLSLSRFTRLPSSLSICE